MIASLLLTCLLAQVAPPPPPPVTPPASSPSTLTLVVSGDALTLHVITAAEKAHPFKALPTREAVASHQVRLLDAAGRSLATVPLDLSALCLLPEHVGEPGHLAGDAIIGHRVLQLVKVPQLPDLHRLRLERRGPLDAEGQATWQLVGLADRPALDRLLAASRRLQPKGR